MLGTPEAQGLETNADLLQFSRGAPSTPPFGSPFPQFTASLRLGYFGRHAKTAANRRLFAERRLCCGESAFAASGRRNLPLADSGGGAEAQASCPASAGSSAPAAACSTAASLWRTRRADAGGRPLPPPRRSNESVGVPPAPAAAVPRSAMCATAMIWPTILPTK